MNIIDYVSTFGKKTFEESPFNEVDALVFAAFSYIGFELAPEFKEDENLVVSLKEFDPFKTKKLFANSVDSAFNVSLFKKMKRSRRFSEIRFGYVEAISDPEKIIQFGALTFFLPDGTMVLSFRGTDATLLGWNEDFLLTYEKEIPSHKLSVDYAHRVLTAFPDVPFYMTGHSKGGNLAVYASAKMRQSDFDRLILAYNFDGPDFRYPPQTVEARRHKWVKYMTKDDMIGIFYNFAHEPAIVYSSGALLGGHDPFFWSVNAKSPAFRRAKDRSRASYVVEKIFTRWLASLNDEDLELAVSGFVRVIGKSKTVYDLLYRGIPDLLNWKKAIKDYPEEKRTRFKEIFLALGKETKKALKEEAKRSITPRQSTRK
ncbi:MAG: DUF2974 domain-containing protein [Bacilli bacterium]|nr:DUF2974 domain-containing protein [Bacilli bacterium]